MNDIQITDFYSVERACAERGVILAGADEAGRGPLAGPVVAAAVILSDVIDGVDDSKKISEKKRERLYEEIISKAKAWSVGIVGAPRIDEVNILNASREAFRTAVGGLALTPDIVYHDQITGLDLRVPAVSVIKGDAKVYSIAAASIIAKVTRDRLMREFDGVYPEYRFSAHKGYGTKTHMEAIAKYGPCELHRRTFLKKFYGDDVPSLSKRDIGNAGEDKACKYIESLGMRIITRNYSIRGGEIDIIARDADFLVFIEVKARTTGRFGTGAEAIDKKKIDALQKTAQQYIFENGLINTPMRFDVIDIMGDKLTYYKNAII